jgi:predicted nucleic acid-binding Zn ribbon protein
MRYKVKCIECGTEDEWMVTLEEYEKRKTEYICNICKSIGSYKQDFTNINVPFVLKGTGWGKSFVTGQNTKQKKVYNELDSELKKNDELHYMADHGVGDFGKRKDTVKKMEDLSASDKIPK